MKRLQLVFLSFSLALYLSTVAQTAINLNLANINNLNFSNIKEYSRYTDPTNPIKVTCGYYSTSDSCFYQCDGGLISKADKKFIKDGKGCCVSKTISFGKAMLTGNGVPSCWGGDYTLISGKDSTLRFKSSDRTILDIKMAGAFQYNLVPNRTYSLSFGVF